jgi:hypothetical protein
MKRHVQVTGVRRWAGDDLVELQSEVFKVLDDFFSQFGNIIVAGCEIDGQNIAPGIVALTGNSPDGNPAFKVVPFEGRTNVTSFPVYLKLKYDTVIREYGDQQTKPVAYSYYAEMSYNEPQSGEYITVDSTGSRRFLRESVMDVIIIMDLPI